MQSLFLNSRNVKSTDRAILATIARRPAKIGHRVDRAKRVRDVSEGEQFHFGRERLWKLIGKSLRTACQSMERRAGVHSGQSLCCFWRIPAAMIDHPGKRDSRQNGWRWIFSRSCGR